MADRYDDRYRGDDRFRGDDYHRGERGYGRDDMDERYGRDWDWGHRMGFDYGRRPSRDWSERGHGYPGERGWPFDAAQGRSGERWGGDRWGNERWSHEWDRDRDRLPLTERIHTEGRTGYYSLNEPRHEPSRHGGPSQYGYGTNNMGTTGYGEFSRTPGYGMTNFGVTYPQRHYTGHGPRGYQRSDDRIREDVCDRLTDDPWVDASDVEITVRGGEVTLSGSVRDRGDKRRTEDIIENISGVREVHNNLRVAHGGDTGTRPQATAATTPPTTSRR
jgi:hypothetical protein